MFGVSLMDIVVIILYMCGMLAIGYISMKKIKGQEDFFLAGRKLGKIVQTFAAFGSGTNADNAVTTARNVFLGGLSGIWTVLHYLFSTPFYWFIAVWMRRFRMVTLADFFPERYESKSLAGGYAVFGLLFFMVYLSLGFSAVGKTILAITPKTVQEMTLEEREEVSRFQYWQTIENKDYQTLTDKEKLELSHLRIERPRGNISHFDPTWTIIIIGVIVLLYGVAGGLQAAFFSDVVQGIFIIILSGILIPFGLVELSSRFHGSGMFDGFRILHDRVPQEYFDILGSASASDFTWYYLLAVFLMNLAGIGPQPLTIIAFGASARDERAARIGAVSGNLLKRFCTVLWCLTALIALGLYANEVSDADQIWGYATRNLLGPVGFGLVGLMIAAILAAFMSSADAYMISCSALVVQNLYKPIIPDRSDKHYLFVARCMSVIVIVGGIACSLYYQDIFQQLKIAWEIQLIFAGAFYVGIFWRKATTAGAWSSVIATAVLFFIIPAVIPAMNYEMRTQSKYLIMTDRPEVQRVYFARELDVMKREAEINEWESLSDITVPTNPKPSPLHIGDEITVTVKPEPKSLYWAKGIGKDEQGSQIGLGFFHYDLYLMHIAGLPLESYANSLIETLRIPLRLIIPFLLVMLVSNISRQNSSEILNIFFAKMKTPVHPNPEEDQKRLVEYAQSSERLRNMKLFPNSSWEFLKWTREDVVGFLLTICAVGIIIAMAMAISAIGA